jgi:hypothetical protein
MLSVFTPAVISNLQVAYRRSADPLNATVWLHIGSKGRTVAAGALGGRAALADRCRRRWLRFLVVVQFDIGEIRPEMRAILARMVKKPKRPKREDAAQSAFRALQHVIETTEGPNAKPPKKAPRKAR